MSDELAAEVRSLAERLGRLDLLASAVAGRTMGVVPAKPGKRSHTDGRTIYIDRDTIGSERTTVVAQAALLAAGSLTKESLALVRRSPRAWRRYLTLEVARAIDMVADVLPPGVVQGYPPRLTASAAESAAVANGRAPVGDGGSIWGELPPRGLVTDGAPAAPARSDALEIGEPDEPGEPDEDGDGEHDVPSRLRQLLSRVTDGQLAPQRRRRRGRSETVRSDTGPPVGARVRMGKGSPHPDAPSVVIPGSSGDDGAARAAATKWVYPEWDCARGEYRTEWSTVHVVRAEAGGAPPIEVRPDPRLRRQLAALHLDFAHARREREGDHLDLDALIESRVDLAAGMTPSEGIYVASRRLRRDLGIMLLLDLSASTAKRARGTRSILDVQRMAAATMIDVSRGLGDRVACLGFRSYGRHRVEIVPLKSFDEQLDTAVRCRMAQVAAGGFTRLGTAIRHAARVLKEDSGTRRWLLVVLSDGFPFDEGYEADYAEIDARMALSEARSDGVGALCVSLGGASDDHRLQRVFGTSAYARADQLSDLSEDLGYLAGAALATADRRHRVNAP